MPILPLDPAEPFAAVLGLMLYPATDESDPLKARARARAAMTEGSTRKVETLLRDLVVEQRLVSSLKPYRKNPHTHTKKQIRQIAASIETFGFTIQFWWTPMTGLSRARTC